MLTKTFPAFSNIKALAYDQPEAHLYAVFQGGSVYRYARVPVELWLALDAYKGSIGQLFYKEIRNAHFAYMKLQADEIPEEINSLHAADVNPEDLPGVWVGSGRPDRGDRRVRGVPSGPVAAPPRSDGRRQPRAQGSGTSNLGAAPQAPASGTQPRLGEPARPAACAECGSRAIVRAGTKTHVVYQCGTCGWAVSVAVAK